MKAKQQGKSPEEVTNEIVENSSKQIKEEEKVALQELITQWMETGDVPSKITEEALNALGQLIAAFDSLEPLLSGDAQSLATNGPNVMASIDKHAIALIEALKKQKNDDPSIAGQKLQTSNKLLKTLTEKLDKISNMIKSLMQDPEKSKVLENMGNVSTTLKNAMKSGQLIKQAMDAFAILTEHSKDILKGKGGLGNKAQNAGLQINKLGGQLYDKHGTSDLAKDGKAAAIQARDKAYNDSIAYGLSEQEARENGAKAYNATLDRYQQKAGEKFNTYENIKKNRKDDLKTAHEILNQPGSQEQDVTDPDNGVD